MKYRIGVALLTLALLAGIARAGTADGTFALQGASAKVSAYTTLHTNGHFILDQMLPSPTLYYVYADAEPKGLGQQVFRFDLDLSAKPTAVQAELGQAGTEASAGPVKAKNPRFHEGFS